MPQSEDKLLFGTVFVGSYESWTPSVWSFFQPATAIVSPELLSTYFYRSDTTRRWERFGYTTDDARSLIEWLNGRRTL